MMLRCTPSVTSKPPEYLNRTIGLNSFLYNLIYLSGIPETLLCITVKIRNSTGIVLQTLYIGYLGDEGNFLTRFLCSNAIPYVLPCVLLQ